MSIALRVAKATLSALVCLLLLTTFLTACSPDDAMSDPVYFTNLYAWSGTEWKHVTGESGGPESDTVWSASPSFGITAEDITNWNAKLSSVTADSPLSGAGTLASHLTVDLSSKQNVHANLTSLSGLTYSAASFVKMTEAGSFSLDTSVYLTGNQNITLSGDLSGSGATLISGTVTGIQGKAITLATGFLKYSGSAWAFDNNTYLTSYMETDPVVKATVGIVKSNGSLISAAGSSDIISTLGYTPEDTANKGAANGYAGLDTGSKVPTTNLGGTGADSTKYLRGDQAWAVPSGSVAWGSITGTLSSQTDLNDALNAKQASHANLSSLSGLTYSAAAFVKMTNANTFTLDTSTYQASHANLSSLSGLNYSATSFIKMTGASTFTLDTTTYLTGNQNITLGGILSGSGTTSITVSAASGYYMPTTSDQTAWNAKQTGHANLTSLSSLAYSATAFVKMTGANTFSLDTATYLTGNQNITLSGDASGSGTTSIAVTNTGLRNVSVPVLSTGYLYYNGSSFAWQTPAGGGYDPIATLDLYDEFASGLLTTGNIGDLGWGLTGTAPTTIASVANHNGIRQLPTTTTSGAITAIWLGTAANTDTVLQTDYCDMTFIVRMTDVTSDTVFVGAMDAMGTAVGNQDRYGFEYIDSSDTYWMMVTGTGSASTRTATNITVAINTWYKLRLVRNGSGVTYYIDGVSKGTINTNMPDQAINVGFHVQTNTTVAKYLQADLFRMTLAVTR